MRFTPIHEDQTVKITSDKETRSPSSETKRLVLEDGRPPPSDAAPQPGLTSGVAGRPQTRGHPGVQRALGLGGGPVVEVSEHRGPTGHRRGWRWTRVETAKRPRAARRQTLPASSPQLPLPRGQAPSQGRCPRPHLSVTFFGGEGRGEQLYSDVTHMPSNLPIYSYNSMVFGIFK